MKYWPIRGVDANLINYLYNNIFIKKLINKLVSAHVTIENDVDCPSLAGSVLPRLWCW
jgi:hypothetical protein